MCPPWEHAARIGASAAAEHPLRNPARVACGGMVRTSLSGVPSEAAHLRLGGPRPWYLCPVRYQTARRPTGGHGAWRVRSPCPGRRQAQALTPAPPSPVPLPAQPSPSPSPRSPPAALRKRGLHHLGLHHGPGIVPCLYSKYYSAMPAIFTVYTRSIYHTTSC